MPGPDNIESQCAHVEYDFKERSRKLLANFYAIAEMCSDRAREILESGEHVGASKERASLSTYMHNAQGAIGEIVRLSPLCGADDGRSREVVIKLDICGDDAEPISPSSD